MYTTHFLSNDPVKIAEFQKYSNKLNQLKNISKKTYFCMHSEMCKSNLKANWKLIGALIKRTTKSQTIPLRIARNNKIYTNNEDIADQFNKHFINVGPNLASKIDKSNENPTQYISFSSINSFVMENVTEAQVSNLFKNLDANKSSIGIPNKLTKIAAEPLSVSFMQIYNQSIETGIVPNILKVSQVTPVYKNGDATYPANYRPISTLSSFSQMSAMQYQTSDIPHQTSEIPHQTSDIPHQMSDIPHRASDFSRLIYHIRHLTYLIRHLTYHITCLTYHIRGAYHLTEKSVRGVESIMVSDIPVYRRIATSVTV